METYYVALFLSAIFILGFVFGGSHSTRKTIQDQSTKDEIEPKEPLKKFPTSEEINGGNKYIAKEVLALIKKQNKIRIITSIKYYRYGQRFYYLVNFMDNGLKTTGESTIDSYCQVYKSDGTLVGGFPSSVINHDDLPNWEVEAKFIDFAYIDPYTNHEMYTKWFETI